MPLIMQIRNMKIPHLLDSDSEKTVSAGSAANERDPIISLTSDTYLEDTLVERASKHTTLPYLV